jgi:Family of unknown function (DUF6328)
MATRADNNLEDPADVPTDTVSDGGSDAADGRRETRNEQRDRNWDDLLQELRVMQTGTQIIAGFLLTLPFQQRFMSLPVPAVVLYLCLVVIAAAATGLMLVPVAVHRELFGLRIKERLVVAGHRVVQTVLWLVGSLVAGSAGLIFYLVLGALAAVAVMFLLIIGLVFALIVYPRWLRSAARSGGGMDRRRPVRHHHVN